MTGTMTRTLCLPALMMGCVFQAALGQTGTQTFDVVSIKPNKSGSLGGAWGVSQNRYFAKNTPLVKIILQAYSGAMAAPDERLKGAPPWVMTEPYDITAKADEPTAESWKGLQQAKQIAIAAPMLRTMLQERCKLVVHTVPTEVQGYALVLGKHGMKMKPAEPDDVIPARAAKFEGGWMFVPIMPGEAKQFVTYLHITMTQLAAFLSVSGRAIVDQTGLTGQYNFELPRIDANPPEGGESASPVPSLDVAHAFDWGAIGLEMKPTKVPALDVVIDHVERPTEN